MSDTVEALLARMTDVERRLVAHASAPLPSGLTNPDALTAERWEAGQVWAHLAEFPAYWLAQAQRVISMPTNPPVPFGRVKTDAGRIEAIEHDRHTDPAALLERVRASLAEISREAAGWSADAWQMRGAHPTAGEMTVERLIERFIVQHLEEHADQLDSLSG